MKTNFGELIMFNRYDNLEMLNNSNNYEEVFNKKNLKFIYQYKTPKFEPFEVFRFPNISFVKHTWTYGDRYFKLAEKYLGDANDWWIIARINNKPTEAHNKLGDILYIPTDVTQIMSLLR